MIFRVLKDHTFYDSRGRPDFRKANTLVNVVQRPVAAELLATGIIGPEDTGIERASGKPASASTKTVRVGIWLATSNFYSGGRIHLYQYAWNLRALGAEVFLITDGTPRWAGDYPTEYRPVIINGRDQIPPDIDLIVTDSKGDLGRKALDYKHTHPWAPFVCFNFETPNWIEKFVPELAAQMQQPCEVFKKADVLLSNSAESARHLLEWIGNPNAVSAVLQPACNDTEPILPPWVNPTGHPYAVWSARSAKYKCGDVAMKSIFNLDIPFDLVCFGNPSGVPQMTPAHKIHLLSGFADREKYAVMAGAHMALAPSLFEGFGMVPAEAMSVGTPCIAYDLPVLREEYAGHPGLLLAKWNDSKDFYSMVSSVAHAPKIAVDPQPIRRDFGMDRMRSRIESLPHHPAKRKKISAQVLAYWGFYPESVESIYPFVDEIFIAGGPTNYAPAIDDGSRARVEALPDPDKKIRVEWRDHWKDKRDMREWCCRQASGNYMLLLDGDEIWTGLKEWIAADLPFGCPRWVNLWHDLDHWIYDDGKECRWGEAVDGRGSLCPHYRWSWWRRSYYWRTHPTPVDRTDSPLHLPRNGEPARKVPECMIYHLGHALSKEVMAAKHQYYLARDGTDAGRIRRRETWHNWNGKLGDCGDGIVAKVDWEIPEIVQRAYRQAP